MARFRPYKSDPELLFPPRPGELVPDDDLVWVIDDIVDRLDLTAIEGKYGVPGAEGFAPRLMLKLLIYGYSQGVFSSRKIERLARREAGGMVLAGGQRPDHVTLARFRRNNITEIAELFHQVLAMCVQLDMLTFGELYLDGSKIKANASKRKANSAERLEQTLDALRLEVDEMLAEASIHDEREDAVYGANSDTSVPDELRTKQERIAKIEGLLEELDARAAEEDRPRKPTDQMNFTDPDSRIMKTSQEGFQQCFNVQAVVDPKHLVIVATDVTQQTNDFRQLIPLLEQAETNLGQPVARIVADAGYHSFENLDHCAVQGVDAYIPLTKETTMQRQQDPKSQRFDPDSSTPFAKHDFAYDADTDTFQCPAGAHLRPSSRPHRGAKKSRTPYYSPQDQCQSCEFAPRCITSKRGYRIVTRDPRDALRDAMYQKLRTADGSKLYAKRKYISEPVFGMQKAGMGFRRFSLRGLLPARAEYAFLSTVHNVKRIWHSTREQLATSTGIGK